MTLQETYDERRVRVSAYAQLPRTSPLLVAVQPQRFVHRVAAPLLEALMMDAEEAERSGLVSRIIPAADLLDEAIRTAAVIAAKSLPIAMMTKETVNRAYETTLDEGVRFERRVFHSMFATNDQKEGMAAFAEKRKPKFSNS